MDGAEVIQAEIRDGWCVLSGEDNGRRFTMSVPLATAWALYAALRYALEQELDTEGANV